jgi:uncharacterized protein (TIGR03435 family)
MGSFGRFVKVTRLNAAFVFMAIVGGGAFYGGTAYGQRVDRMSAFEAVSIKPSPPASGPALIFGGPGSTDPERLTIRHYSVQNLIVKAYYLTHDIQISSLDKLPASESVPFPWIEVDPFDIVAKVPPGAAKEQLGPMLQNMLAERFDLKVHFEKKEMPIYNLVVAKAGVMSKGLVLTSTIPDPANSEPPKPFTLPAGGGAPFATDKNGFPIIPKGSIVTRAGLGGYVREIWQKETMEKLAAELSNRPATGRVVRDATGLKDEYDFSMYWTEEPISFKNGVRVLPAEPLGGPSLFEALEKQLGLKLVQSKGPVDFLVIDHIDRTPTEN